MSPSQTHGGGITWLQLHWRTVVKPDGNFRSLNNEHHRWLQMATRRRIWRRLVQVGQFGREPPHGATGATPRVAHHQCLPMAAKLNMTSRLPEIALYVPMLYIQSENDKRWSLIVSPRTAGKTKLRCLQSKLLMLRRDTHFRHCLQQQLRCYYD